MAGEWRRARESFLASAEGFQAAAGFRSGQSAAPRLDGAVFAASNAALMLAQLGDEEGAIKEMQAIVRWAAQRWRPARRAGGGCKRSGLHTAARRAATQDLMPPACCR